MILSNGMEQIAKADTNVVFPLTKTELRIRIGIRGKSMRIL